MSTIEEKIEGYLRREYILAIAQLSRRFQMPIDSLIPHLKKLKNEGKIKEVKKGIYIHSSKDSTVPQQWLEMEESS